MIKAPFMIVCVERPEMSTEVNASKTNEFRLQLEANTNCKAFDSGVGRSLGMTMLFTVVPCEIDDYLAMQLCRTAYRYGQRSVLFVDPFLRVWRYPTDLHGQLVSGDLCGVWTEVEPEAANLSSAWYKTSEENFYVVQ